MSVSDSAEPAESYGQILKSTALIGASSLINVAFGIIRSKAMAMLLGPAGVGLIGIFNSLADLCQITAGLGVQNSGVRQIASAGRADGESDVARITTVLRWLSLGLGTAGALLLMLLSGPVAEVTFGDPLQSGAVALLGVAVGL